MFSLPPGELMNALQKRSQDHMIIYPPSKWIAKGNCEKILKYKIEPICLSQLMASNYVGTDEYIIGYTREDEVNIIGILRPKADIIYCNDECCKWDFSKKCKYCGNETEHRSICYRCIVNRETCPKRMYYDSGYCKVRIYTNMGNIYKVNFNEAEIKLYGNIKEAGSPTAEIERTENKKLNCLAIKMLVDFKFDKKIYEYVIKEKAFEFDPESSFKTKYLELIRQKEEKEKCSGDNSFCL